MVLCKGIIAMYVGEEYVQQCLKKVSTCVLHMMKSGKMDENKTKKILFSLFPFFFLSRSIAFPPFVFPPLTLNRENKKVTQRSGAFRDLRGEDDTFR